ncbi:MAG TPA: hypothetical protein DEF00_01535 [Candidatus Taylorbacteria bacterium]|nr:MAG: Methyltransferase type 11 [Parcubacteria group bacterium GW2011_GWA2_47_64]KKU96759.1 MAG: Methyltransferase type 11 [Parcubacteria group bacterium GW2011_GWC2_48_17]HBV01059.1 hypothetical protein [Candidatus Taylorbacteria bacterium]
MSKHGSDTITGFRARFYSKIMSVCGAERVYRQALSLLKPRAHERLLDVGCGTGTFLKLLRANSSIPLALTGVDASDDMLHEARKNAGDISFQYADASSLPFRDKTFNAVVSILALHHMPCEVKKKAIGEIARVLKKDGRVVILDLFRPNTRLGGFFSFWFNLHSYTKGNWEFTIGEIEQNGFIAVKEGTVRGFVGYLVAEYPQGG